PPHPPDLHSFPTRRSSDLHVALSRPEFRAPAETPAVFPRALRTAVNEKRQRIFLFGIESRGLQDPHLHRIAAGAFDRDAFGPRQDRKSTRLNSSHRTISYA